MMDADERIYVWSDDGLGERTSQFWDLMLEHYFSPLHNDAYECLYEIYWPLDWAVRQMAQENISMGRSFFHYSFRGDEPHITGFLAGGL